MNLLQLAAKEVTKWPEFAEWLVQSENTGEIIFDADGGCATTADFKAQEIADDADHVVVTRAQWEAERARISNMKHGAHKLPSADDYEFKDGMIFHKATGYVMQMDTRTEAEKQYEQELWDKVAERVFSMAFVDGLSGWVDVGFEIEARRAMTAADAFMAERAKRLKK